MHMYVCGVHYLENMNLNLATQLCEEFKSAYMHIYVGEKFKDKIESRW